ncbi:MAG: NUDIX hydrolase N-terminal domain-containing protein [Acidimicrobiia bacterium]
MRRLQAIAQSGLTFADGVFDRQRYEEVRRIAAEMAAHPSADPDSIASVFSGLRGYATPLLIARGAVFDPDQRILMVREAADGRWTLPGGWIDVGEPPSKSVEREIREESGYLARAIKLAAVFDKLRHPYPAAPQHAYLLFFVCELLGGEPTTSVETTEVGWFGEGDIPDLSLGRIIPAHVRRMFDHLRDPALATDFD